MVNINSSSDDHNDKSKSTNNNSNIIVAAVLLLVAVLNVKMFCDILVIIIIRVVDVNKTVILNP